MAIMRIKQLGDPILREKCAPIYQSEMNSKQLYNLFTDLRDTLKHFQLTHGTGRGIAGPQIGVAKRVVCIDCTAFKYDLVNPEIVKVSEEVFTVWDSCFSYWGIVFQVRRYKQVTIKYFTPQGEPKMLEAEGDLAELLQHELEHLDGIVAIDQLVPAGSICTDAEYRRH